MTQTKKAEIRLKKYNDFQSFIQRSTASFTLIAKEDENHSYYEQRYSLCITPGGSQGGTDKTVLEVFYGARPYDSYDSRPASAQVGMPPGKTKQQGFRVEVGARLVYLRNPKGGVNCLLQPAKTEYEKPIEDAIQLAQDVDPALLGDDKLLRKHWRHFMAYMAVTSLDGSPSFLDRARVLFIRFWKRRFRDGLDLRPRWMTCCQQIGKWIFTGVITVGLSGWLLNYVNSGKPVSLDSAAMRSIESITSTEKIIVQELVETQKQVFALDASVKSLGQEIHQIQVVGLHVADAQKSPPSTGAKKK